MTDLETANPTEAAMTKPVMLSSLLEEPQRLTERLALPLAISLFCYFEADSDSQLPC